MATGHFVFGFFLSQSKRQSALIACSPSCCKFLITNFVCLDLDFHERAIRHFLGLSVGTLIMIEFAYVPLIASQVTRYSISATESGFGAVIGWFAFKIEFN